jgi:hypothetical protein
MRYVLIALLLLFASPVLAQRDIKQKLNADTRKPNESGWLIRAERQGVIAPAMLLPSEFPLLRPVIRDTSWTTSRSKIIDTPPMERIRVSPEEKPRTR